MLHNSNGNNLSLKRPSLWSGIEVDDRELEETKEFKLKKKEQKAKNKQDTWFVLDFDKKTNKYLSVIKGDTPEIGYFTIQELQKVNKSNGFVMDDEQYFNSCSIDSLLNQSDSNSPIICS